jgi:hypothetical protein
MNGVVMVYIYRLIIFFIFIVSSFSSLAAIPQATVFKAYVFFAGFSPATASIYSSPSSACSALSPLVNATGYYAFGGTIFSNGVCYLTYRENGAITTTNTWLESFLSCPVNSTLSGSSCICNLPSIENSTKTACESAPDLEDAVCKAMAKLEAASGGNSSGYYVPGKQYLFGTVCLPTDGVSAGKGCTIAFTPGIAHKVKGKDTWETWGQGSRPAGSSICSLTAGADTSPVPVPPASDPSAIPPVPPASQPAPPPVPASQSKCPSGMEEGLINLVTVCMPTRFTTETETRKTKTVDGVDQNGNPVSTTEKTVTNCVEGKCITTKETSTTSKGSDGAPVTTTKTTSTSEPKSDFCTNNPKAIECGQKGDGESSFGGNCKGGFECKGDALQCAMAEEQYKTNCKLYENDDNAESVFNKALSGKDELNTDQLKKEAEKIDIRDLDSNGYGWSSSCPADPVIQLSFGRNASFAIPFSRICGPLGAMSSAGVGITLLGAMLWVLGSKKSS